MLQVRHKPNIPLPLPGRAMEGKNSEETLQIRLYAVDCPEVAHFGNPAQPFSKEAKEVRDGDLLRFLIGACVFSGGLLYCLLAVSSCPYAF